MMATATCLPADLFEPRSLMVLMGLYERNYRWLVELLGDPERLPQRKCLRLRGMPMLHVEVRRCSRHTIELALTHRFGGERLPDLAVRLYRDAKLAEALPLADGRRYADPLARLPARWQANVLLYKWLEYCRDARLGRTSLRLVRKTV